MRLNGWQRMYVVVAMLVGIPSAAIGFYSMPNEREDFYTSCDTPSYATAEEASRLLTNGKWREWTSSTEPTCMLTLQKIADGTTYRQSMKAWRDGWRVGLISFVIFFGAIYLLGLGVGWIWRGFFPKKTPA